MFEELDVSGFTVRPGALTEPALVRLLGACAPTAEVEPSRHPSGATYGIRGLLWASSGLRAELDASGVSMVAREVLGARAVPVDAIFFDKQPDANWSVPGHQDRLMPIESGSAVAKTVRNGIAYAEPSPEILATLIAVRVHFDEVAAGDGALEVVPGSHRLGVLTPDAIRDIPLSDYRAWVVARGDVLVIRPLLLHRSGRRAGAGHRRVLHVVYAADQPAGGARWRFSA
jgi:hypothetical protein